MLDQNDIKRIGTLLESTEGKLKKFVQEELEENNKKLTKEIVGEVGTFITENVLTTIDDVEERLSKKLNTLPDKDDFSRGIADVKGMLVAKLRTEDEKVNLLIQFLREKNILNEEQWKALRELQVFPSIEM